jgi:uncharacterized delta-60 repeat protein
MGCKSLIDMARGMAAVLLCTWLVACGGGEGEPPDDEDEEVPATYQLKVSVLGLKGTGLVLSNAEGILEIPTDGTFAFAAPLEAGSNYFVKIVTQPTGPQQTCSLGNPGGQDIHADATVFVTCVDHVPMKAVINGFQADSLEVLLSNAPDSSQCCNLAATLIVTENGEHTFAAQLPAHSYYEVVAGSTQDETQVCKPMPGDASGIVPAGTGETIYIDCEGVFEISGTVKGLRGTGLSVRTVLQGVTQRTWDVPLEADGQHKLAKGVNSGDVYLVQVTEQPTDPVQDCKVSGGSGTVAKASITDVLIDCRDPEERPARRWRMTKGLSSGQAGYRVLAESPGYPDWQQGGAGLHTVEAGDNSSLIASYFSLPEDDIANAEVYSGTLGRTYWVTAEAPHTGNSRNYDPEGRNEAVSWYAQRQSYLKTADHSALQLKVTELLLVGHDFDDGSYVGGRDGDSVWARADLEVTVSRGIETDGSAEIVDEQHLKVLLQGREGRWNVTQFLQAQSSGRIVSIDLGQAKAIDFLDDANADGEKRDAVVSLREPIEIDLDLSGIAIGEQFTVEAKAMAMVHDPSDFEMTFAAAHLRDPLKTTAVEPGGSRTASARALHKLRASQAVAPDDLDSLGFGLVPVDLEVTNQPFLGEPTAPPPGPPACATSGAPGAVAFDASNYRTTEAAAYNTQPIFLTRTGGSSGDLEVTVETAGGTATVNGDYRPVSLRVRWADGDSLPRLVEIPLIADADVEPEETVELRLADAACGSLGGVDSATLTIVSEDTEEIPVYSVGGTVSGLSGTGLVIREGLNEIAITANGVFAFPADLLDGWEYDVRVKTQPVNPRQVCTVTNGKGTIAGADVTNVFVSCVDAAIPGALDTTFGNGGMVTDPVLVRGAEELAILPDGGIVVADSFKRVARYSRDGVLDTNFGTEGEATVIFSGQDTDEVRALAVQPDGKIVVAGFSRAGISDDDDFAVARLNPDGTLDTSFGTGGKVITDFFGFFDRAHFVLIQPDGRIIVGGEAYTSLSGNSEIAVVRYLSDGSLDPGFGTGGKALADLSARDAAYAGALRADGSIVIAGGFGVPSTSALHADSVLMQLRADGSVDTSFGVNGIRAVDLAAGAPDWLEAVAIDADGRVVGALGSGFGAARFSADGALDATFGTDGVALVDFGGQDAFVRGIALQDGGEVLLAGWMRSSSTFRTDCAIARLSTSGQLDTTFATGGKLLVDFFGADDGAFAIAPQDGHMIVSGLAMSGSTRLAALLRLSL